MELDDRKVMILNAVIKNYMETGEPVGSRTISKLPGCALSSATIRNEMYDLEEMGYLLQPHTSAGRIPSDQGYRFYVNEILRETENEVEALKRQFVARVTASSWCSAEWHALPRTIPITQQSSAVPTRAGRASSCCNSPEWMRAAFWLFWYSRAI